MRFIEVNAVVSEFLRYNLELFYALGHKFAHLVQYVLHRAALVFAGNDRNGAIGAVPVAPFRYFDVGIVLGRGGDACSLATNGGARFIVLRLQVVDEFLPVKFAVELVHFGNFLAQLVHIAFRQAAHYKHLVKFAVVLQLAEFKNFVDTFLLGRGYKATCVDDSNVAMCVFGVMVHHIAMLLKHAEQFFRVHKVFGAPHGYDVNVVLILLRIVVVHCLL